VSYSPNDNPRWDGKESILPETKVEVKSEPEKKEEKKTKASKPSTNVKEDMNDEIPW